MVGHDCTRLVWQSKVVVVWVLLMNTKNAYSDEEMRKFQDIDFDADWVERQVLVVRVRPALTG